MHAPHGIGHLYSETEYVRDQAFYNLYRKTISSIFDFRQFENIADVGCSNGGVLASIKNTFPHLTVAGFDGFEWAKDHASAAIKEAITITDLRKPFAGGRQWDVVNCTEVGEHIEPEHEKQFLDTLAEMTRHVLVLSWSPYPGEQHLNPQPVHYIRRQIEDRGFVVAAEATRRLQQALRYSVSPYGYHWWAENIVVYLRRHPYQTPKYRVFGCTDGPQHPKLVYGAGYQERFLALTKFISGAVHTDGATISRVSDGEYYFLRKKTVGSASPGKRGSTLPYDQIDIRPYRFGVFLNDKLSFNPELGFRRHLLWYLLTRPVTLTREFARRLIKLRDVKGMLTVKRRYLSAIWDNLAGPAVPHDVVYALVATRWIFRAFPNQVGLIGNEHKMKLIKELMLNPEYQQYLGTQSFTDYVGVPQKGAADRPDELARQIGEQIANSSAKVFLVGMGHAKTAVLHQLKRYTDAVIIDVGVGIDAIAGCVHHERPQMVDWKNYRLKNYDYGPIDQMDYKADDPENKRRTVWLQSTQAPAK